LNCATDQRAYPEKKKGGGVWPCEQGGGRLKPREEKKLAGEGRADERKKKKKKNQGKKKTVVRVTHAFNLEKRKRGGIPLDKSVKARPKKTRLSPRRSTQFLFFLARPEKKQKVVHFPEGKKKKSPCGPGGGGGKKLPFFFGKGKRVSRKKNSRGAQGV